MPSYSEARRYVYSSTLINSAVLDEVVLKCEPKEQEEMPVTFHDLNMLKHKVCEEKKEEQLRNWEKIGGGDQGERKSRKHKEYYIFRHLFLFLFHLPQIELVSDSEKLLMAIAYSSSPYCDERNGLVAS